MKILHILNTNKFSGAENVVCQIIGMFKNEQDYNMVYCSLDGPIRETLKNKNIQFEPISKMSISEIKRVIKKVKPDIIHAHDMRASLFAALSCGKVPQISHIHNNNINSRINFRSISYVFAAMKAKRIIWVSNSSLKGYPFNKLIDYKSVVLYNVINKEELYKKNNDDLNEYSYDIIFLGRLSNEKNPLRFINIIKDVKKEIPTIRTAVVGDGTLMDGVKSSIIKNNLQNNIELLGFKDNPTKILSSSKCMVMTSVMEGTPMSALEALAFGVPIISTPVGGLNDLVENNVNGYLSNDNNELAMHIIDLINNKILRDRLSLGALDKFEKYNAINKYKETLKIVYEV